MSFLPVDVIVDQKGKERHRIDSLNLLAYVVLLVLVLVTTWILKRRRRLCIHETGLAIIYGMILGAALRYGGLEVRMTSEMLKEDPLPLDVPADYVIVKARILGDANATRNHSYAYEFRGELGNSSETKLGSQISYASVDPEVFFNIILPPIVLNAGLSLKRRHFFRNIGAIFTYAFVGTSISVAFVGGFIYGAIQLLKSLLGHAYLADQFSLSNCLYFGAIISPTDPLAVLAIFQELGVDVNLFALVFGESILNDAVSIVLTHSIDQFSVIYARNPYYPPVWIVWECITQFSNMFLSSCCLGVLFGVVTSLTTKFSELTETPLLETSLVVLMSYSSFLTAEVLDASGIVAILLCGITQAHYTINNLSFEARERIKNLFELLTFLCENFLFLAVGVAFWQRGQTWDLPFIGLAFVGVVLARALSVYPLTGLLNLGRRNRIPCSFTHLIAWGGAARGVISYSLAARNTVGDARRIMLSTTSVIVIFSVIVVGGSVDWMLRVLRIPFNGSPPAARGPEDSRPAHITANDPSWQVRRKRLNRSSGSEASLINGGGFQHTPTLVSCSSFNNPHYVVAATSGKQQCAYHSHHQQPQATPVLEVEAVWAHGQRHQLKGRAEELDQASLVTHYLPQGDAQHGASLSAPLPILPEAETRGFTVGSLDEAPVTPPRPTAETTTTSAKQPEAAASAAQATNNQTTSTTTGAYENASLVRRWRNLDNNFIKPLLTNSHPTLMETLPPSLRHLGRLFTSDEQLQRNYHARS